MGFLARQLQERFDAEKPPALQADIRMISGCDDHQTSADVSNVSDFRLPDPAGMAGGACTSTLLSVVYKDNEDTSAEMTYREVIDGMRAIIDEKGYTQIPQLTSSNRIEVNEKFDFTPPSATGTKRALLIGINYIGHESGVLSGCHNDVLNMVEYIKNVHGFEDENITILLDDDEHTSPTYENMIEAYKTLVEQAEPGDALFCHYSGHGCGIKDDESEESDGKDEALVPVDYLDAGVIRDDELYDILIKPLKDDVHLLAIMDCCHSGSILDLPYLYKGGGEFSEMGIQQNYKFGKLFKKFGQQMVEDLLQE